MICKCLFFKKLFRLISDIKFVVQRNKFTLSVNLVQRGKVAR